MSRPLMFQEHAWQAFEMTMRCMQSRLLLRPGDECNRRMLGVIGRAQALYGEHVKIYFAGGTSNHLHIVAAFENAEWKARFKSHIKTNISKEIGDLYDWAGSHWDRRTRDIAILDDEAFEARLAYLAAHGVKDGLVSTPGCWPGIQWVRAVTEGKALVGVWYNRTRLDALHRAWERQPKAERGRRPTIQDVAESYRVELSAPPMWAHLDVGALRARWVEVVGLGVERHPAPWPRTVMGAQAVVEADPHSRPVESKRSAAPMVHTSCGALRRAWMGAYRGFVESYRAALAALRAGWDAVGFPPEGCRPAVLLGGGGG